jgi:hypothetical protein
VVLPAPVTPHSNPAQQVPCSAITLLPPLHASLNIPQVDVAVAVGVGVAVEVAVAVEVDVEVALAVDVAVAVAV